MANEIEIMNNQISRRLETNIAGYADAGIRFPVGYVPENAIKSAMYTLSKVEDKDGQNMLKKAVMNAHTYASVVNAVNDMLIQGLDTGKKQAYFIAYGDEIQLQRSYFGTVTTLKRLPEIKNVVAYDYYTDNVPEFEFDIMTNKVKIKNWSGPDHISDELAGAFSVIELENGTFEISNMNITEIHKSWSQSKNWGTTVWLNSKEEIEKAKADGQNVTVYKNGKAKYTIDGPNEVQKKFPGEMAKRTVLNRASKLYINTSDIPSEMVRAINQTTENEYLQPKEVEPTPERDYVAEINSAKDTEALDYLWSHIIPDDKKQELIPLFQAKVVEVNG